MSDRDGRATEPIEDGLVAGFAGEGGDGGFVGVFGAFGGEGFFEVSE